MTSETATNAMTSSERQSDVTVRTLPHSRRTCLLEPLDVNHLGPAYALVTDAAQRGDNVGEDEYPNVEYLRFVLGFCSAWALKDLGHPGGDQKQAGGLAGLLVVGPCRFSRSHNPTLAEAIIVTSRTWTESSVLRDLAQAVSNFTVGLTDQLAFAVQLACQLVEADGFGACLLEVFLPCTTQLLAFRAAGFVTTGVVPRAGTLSGHRGHVSNYLLYKHLADLPMPVPSSDVDNALLNFTPTLLPFPAYVPFSYRLRSGEEIIVRALHSDEVSLFYDALKSAAASGAGYGWDELPNVEYFARWYVHDFYNYVVQQAGPSGKIICFQNFGPSVFSRSVNNGVLSDGNIVILPEFRGKRMSEELMSIHESMGLDCGYTCRAGEAAATNLAFLMGVTRASTIATGTIPSAIFFKEHGWVDLVTMYASFGLNNKPMKDILHASKL